MLAYQTTAHDGPMGTDFAFANVNNPNVAVKAVKKAERSDKTIVRFYELTNSAQDVEVEFPAEIISAEEVNGVEELVGEASFSGRKLSFNIDRFHPKTFALTFASSSTVGGTMPAPASIGVDLDYNIDVVSGNDNRADADIAKAYPAELLADKLVADGITFNMGSRAYATDNAIRCEGQVVALPSNNGTAKLYMLASSLNESGSDAVFGIGGEDVNVRVEYNGGYVGVWSNSTDVQKHYRTENTAFTATHSHVTASGKDGVFDYLYMYKYVLPLPSGATELVLPNNPDILVYAVTLSDNRNDDTRPLSQIVQVLNHTDTEDTYKEVHHEDPIVEPVTVKASAYTNDSESPEKAADGDTGTKWCDNSSTVKWLEYKFDKPISISGWRVVNAGSESEDMIASEYYLQRYVDNGWVDVEGVHGNETNTTDLVLERPFVTTAVRLRIVSPERSTKGAARVYEFSVYGRDASAEDMARSQIISRRPTYGYGKQVARVVKSSGRVNVSEDARFILDSDRTTKWCYNGSVSKPYVIVELAGIYNVDRFDIYDSRTMEDYDNSDEYAISVSLDGKTFSTVASETGVSDESRHVCILPEPVAARYVKLQIGKGGSGAVRVYGFDIWGVFKENVEEGNDLPASIGKTILGSSDVKNFDETALNLVDGVSDVAELSWNFDNKGSGSPINWVVVDLEDSYSIDRLTLYDCKNQNNVENVTGYRVYTSTIAPTEEEMGRFNKVPGGTKWRRVASVTDDGGDIKTFSLDEPVVARYVKLEVPYKNVSDSAMLREFEIYGNLVSTNISGTLGDGLVDIYPCVVERGDDIHIVVSKDASYTLCSVGGEVVKTGIARGDTPVVTSSLPSGIYLVRVVTDKYAVCRKVVVR